MLHHEHCSKTAQSMLLALLKCLVCGGWNKKGFNNAQAISLGKNNLGLNACKAGEGSRKSVCELCCDNLDPNKAVLMLTQTRLHQQLLLFAS